jgi:hypothetical protein
VKPGFHPVPADADRRCAVGPRARSPLSATKQVHWVSKLREICFTLGLMDEPRPHAPTHEE